MVHLKLVSYYLGLIKGEGPDPVYKKSDPDPDRHQNIANPQYWYRCIGYKERFGIGLEKLS